MEFFIICITLIVGAYIVFNIINNVKNETRKIITSVPVNYVSGLEHMSENSKVMLTQWDSEVEINQKIRLPIARINGSEVVYGTHLSTGGSSPLGRAAVGGLMFGGIGAIVGAVSGTATTTKTSPRYFLIINYTTKDGQEANLVFSSDTVFKKEIMKISNYVNSEVGYKPEYDPDNIEL